MLMQLVCYSAIYVGISDTSNSSLLDSEANVGVGIYQQIDTCTA